MKAITLTQPRSPNENMALAYLAGVIHGDGYLTSLTLGLYVADQDFAEVFARAIGIAFGVTVTPALDRKGYWITRTSNRSGRFDELRTFKPFTNDECAAWVRGLFDSEGNAQLSLHKHVGPNSYGRRVAMYNTRLRTLVIARRYLTQLGIETGIRKTTNSAGHLGDKRVYELYVRPGRENYQLFAFRVGSSLSRKAKVLEQIHTTYKTDMIAHYREMQLLGAAAKHERTMQETLPAVVAGVRELIRQGIKPTQENCRVIRGYNTVQRWIRQADLVALAMKEEE